MPLTENELQVLSKLKGFKEGTVYQLGNLIRRPNEGIRGTLRNLEKKGLTERVGDGKWKVTQDGKNALDN